MQRECQLGNTVLFRTPQGSGKVVAWRSHSFVFVSAQDFLSDAGPVCEEPLRWLRIHCFGFVVLLFFFFFIIGAHPISSYF